MHKLVVKKGIPLFLPVYFLKNRRLVRAVKRTNISLAELSKILSVLIYSRGGKYILLILVNAYIKKHFNRQLKKLLLLLSKHRLL